MDTAAAGAVAAYGVPQKAGADAYFKMLNAQGGINGRKVDWTVKDNAFDPQQTVQIARQLDAGQDKVVAIVNANGTAQAEAAFPFVLTQSKVPIVDEQGGSESWYRPPRPGSSVRRPCTRTRLPRSPPGPSRTARRRSSSSTVAPAAFVNVAKQVEPVAKKVDPSVVVDRLAVKFQTTDYTPVVSKVKAEKPDAVILILTSPEAAAYLKEARLQGLAQATYGYTPWPRSGRSPWPRTPPRGSRPYNWVKAPSDAEPAVQEFRTAMACKPGQDAGFLALWGWSNAKVFAQIVKTIKEPSPRPRSPRRTRRPPRWIPASRP